MNKKTINLIVIFILVAGVSFYAGTKYSSGKVATTPSTIRGSFPGGQRVGRNGGGFTTGEIISKDATSMTVKLQAGGSKIVFLSTNTKVSKSVDGTSADLLIGKEVSVAGTANPDGSVVAESVQIRTTRPPSSQTSVSQ